MHPERPASQADFRAMVAAIRAALAAGRDHATIPLAGAELRMEPLPGGGHQIRGAPALPGWRIVGEPSRRPADYPDELPFLAEELATTGAHGTSLSVAWWAPTESTRAVESLHEQTLAAGWTPEPPEASTGPAPAQRRYRKGTVRRDIICDQGAIILIDRDAGEGARCRVSEADPTGH